MRFKTNLISAGSRFNDPDYETAAAKKIWQGSYGNRITLSECGVFFAVCMCI
jgi:hypothetical protein